MFYNDIITPYYYEAEPMNTVIKYKFKYRREIAGFMAGKIAEKLDSIYPEGFFDCICFVPQTKDEMSKRGFNQAQLLASELSEIMETEIHCSIAKLYDTKRQHDLSSTERSGNVFGVFDITESEKITDKKILLVDDIKTTGATLNECAKMLKIRGAYSVTGAVFAIPRKGGRD